MIFLRSITFNIAMYGSGAVLSLWTLVLRCFAPAKVLNTGRLWAAFTIAALRVICRVELQVEGIENLPQSSALIAAQHQSALDIMIWLRLLPRPAYVFKRELLKIPVFGAALLPAGMIAVDRGGKAGSLRKMVEECRAALAAGRQIVIFPEGTRVAPGERSLLQPGIVALSKTLNIDVIPAAINSGYTWSRKAFLKTPGIVRVKIYPALSCKLRREDIIAQLTSCFYEKGVR